MTESAKEIFFEALHRADREAYLRGACGVGSPLRAEVDALLRAHATAEGFLMTGTRDDPSGPIRVSLPAEPGEGSSIGAYTILSVLGEGGFGTVYLARQEHPIERRVALKVLKPGMDSRQVIRRFEAERQALAMMDHPSIARVFDAGATEAGRPYFVMEHVEGAPITEYADARRLSMRERLSLFEEVCLAVQHAHNKGVIHRDIKPSNVLVAEVDGRAQVKVIDFGIAKAIGEAGPDASAITQGFQVIGTPAYMAPEQAAPGAGGVDTRTDVYSLGVLLYELLTGVTPLDRTELAGAGPAALARMIAAREPAKPSSRIADKGEEWDGVAGARGLDTHRLWRALRGDLDWIVLRALEKDPARRYPTANALGADVRRYLRHEPVEAGPPSRAYRLARFVRRRRVEVGAAAAVAVAVVLLAIGGVWFGLRERAAAGRAEAQLSRANALTRFAQDVITGVDPANAKDLDTALLKQILARATQRVPAELADQPDAAVSMLNTIGYAYFKIAEYEEAEAMFRSASKLGSDRLGPEHPETLGAASSLAGLLIHTARYDEAERIIVPVLGSFRRLRGDDNEQTMTAMSNLAALQDKLGRTAEARGTLEALLAARRRVLGPSHEQTLLSMNNLAMVYDTLGDEDRARAMLREILERQLETKGEDDPRTLATMNNLAANYRSAGRHGEAEEMLRRVLEAKRRVLPPDHPSTLVTLHNLGSTLNAAGRPGEAEAVLRGALESSLRSEGESGQHTLAILNELGTSLRKLGRAAEAAPLIERSLEGYRTLAGPTHPHTLGIMNNLVGTRLKAGAVDEAWRDASEAVRLAEEAGGPTSPQVVVARTMLARVMSAKGEREGAEELLRGLHRECAAAIGAEHRSTRQVADALAELLGQWGREADALVWRGRAGE